MVDNVEVVYLLRGEMLFLKKKKEAEYILKPSSFLNQLQNAWRKSFTLRKNPDCVDS